MRTSLLSIVSAASLGVLSCTGGTNTQPAATSGSPGSSKEAGQPVAAGEAPADDGRMYDPATVETLRGRVAAVDRMPPDGGRSGGVHLDLTTEGGETISVRLGPAWFVDTQAMTFGVGDTLSVTGSRVTLAGAPALIARTVVKDGQTLVLRDEAGVPSWSGRGGGRARR